MNPTWDESDLPPHCRGNEKGITSSSLSCSETGFSFEIPWLHSKRGAQHADYHAEGSIDYPAIAWAECNHSK
jgi:hypothetical protein